MLSTTPIDLKTVKPENINKEILRQAIIAEQDAVSLYEQMSDMTKDAKLKKLLLDVAKEEKTHIGEFHEYLKQIDKEYDIEIQKGKEEVSSVMKESKAEKLLKLLETISPEKAKKMADNTVKIFKDEGWKPKTKKEAINLVDEFIDSSLGWPTVPKKMSTFQKEARKIMIDAILKEFNLKK